MYSGMRSHMAAIYTEYLFEYKQDYWFFHANIPYQSLNFVEYPSILSGSGVDSYFISQGFVDFGIYQMKVIINDRGPGV